MKRILLVDDNLDFLHLLSSILKKQLHIYEAEGVQEAINLLESVTVDGICSDFNMRDGTGLELLKMLRQQEIKIPFMLMSASDDSRLASEVQDWDALFCCKTDYDLIAKITDMF